MIAGKKNHIDSLMFLLEHGGDPSAKDKNDRNVYHHTAVEGCLDALKVPRTSFWLQFSGKNFVL